MNIEPIAFFHSPLTSKFGIPRQSGLAPAVPGRIVFTPDYRHQEAIRGLEAFDYLWIIWEFSVQSSTASTAKLTVRPPRLGGNERIGVFASRSPFRPNRLGLSCVHINKVELNGDEGPVIHVTGADLMDGTPIYDIKPYVTYADSHPEARGGFAQEAPKTLAVVDDHGLLLQLPAERRQALEQTLRQDPRPHYQDDPQRVYAMPFDRWEVRFRVDDAIVYVVDVK